MPDEEEWFRLQIINGNGKQDPSRLSKFPQTGQNVRQFCQYFVSGLLPFVSVFFFQTRRVGEEGLRAGLVDISGALLPS